MKTSSGVIPYRFVSNSIEVMIVHPSGNYNKNKPWSIAKGQQDKNESLIETAKREAREETRINCPADDLFSLGEVYYKHKNKVVYAFCFQWKPEHGEPKCNSWEVDRAEFVDIDKAYELLQEAQKEFIIRLKKHLK